MKGKKNPSSWRDQIREAPAPIVSKVPAMPLPQDARIKGGEVRIGQEYIGRVVKGNHSMYYPVPLT
jgi:hypothetical protein